MYIILYGSVSKRVKQEQEEDSNDKSPIPDFITTLFDGELFGIPVKTNTKILNYSVTAI